jgi:hypothetical protein
LSKYSHKAEKSFQPFDSIICNGITVEPEWKQNKLYWRILTPASFVKGLTSEPQEFEPVIDTIATQRMVVQDISTMIFSDADEFVKYLINTK